MFGSLQDGRLYLIVTRNGRVVRRLTVPSAGRLDDNQRHRVILTRDNRRVSRNSRVIVFERDTTN